MLNDRAKIKTTIEAIAMNCQNFLENATRIDGELASSASAHLAACEDCRGWYADVREALTLFAAANAGPMAISVSEPEHAPRVEGKSDALALSKLLEERSAIARQRAPEIEDKMSRATQRIVTHQLTRPSRVSGKSSRATISRRTLHRLGNAALQVAVAAVILLLAFSFLQLPDSAEPSAPPLAASLLDTNGTLDSIGLVSACVGPGSLDVHSAVISQHLQELPCCTRCHVAPADSQNVGAPHGGRFAVTGGSETSLLAGEHPPQLSSQSLNQLSASCLLCHKG